MSDPFGVYYLTAAHTPALPLTLTLAVPTGLHAVVAVVNLGNDGPLLAKAASDTTWVTVPRDAEIGLIVPTGDTLQLAVNQAQYRAMSVLTAAPLTEVPYRTLVTLRQVLAADGAGGWQFGDGSDGDLVLDAPLTLAAPMQYDNLELQDGAAILSAGYPIFVNGVLDITAASVGALGWDGVAGGSAAATVGGAGGGTVRSSTSWLGGSPTAAGTAGANGGAAGGTAATSSAAAAAVDVGGRGGAGGAGGAGSGGAGGIAGTNYTARGAAANALFGVRMPPLTFPVGAALYLGGLGGGRGGSGGGDGTAGGGSGQGGGAAGVVAVFARAIRRSDVTAAGALSARGGVGGDGGTPAGGNRGGGSGGGGGGGGLLYVVCGSLLGTTAAGALSAAGGDGGDGGDGTGTGIGGEGGGGGEGGVVQLFNLGYGTVTRSAYVAGAAGAATVVAAGTVGGGGGASVLDL